MNLVIDYLKNHSEHVSLLSSWMFDTWGHYNPESSLEKAQEKLQSHLNVDSLPLAYIALIDGKPVGMCSLRINYGLFDLAPWLGSLFVEPLLRGQGIGEKLIQVVTKKACSMGYPKLYLLTFDETLPNWYIKLGWKLIGMNELNGHPVSVMEFKNEN